jgi:two-component system sensor histidine kinase/response regulator
MHDNKPHILVIEDDDFMGTLLQFVLERQHMQVTRVADGRAALERIDLGAPVDAVVLDWMLPQVSGLEVLAHLRQHPDWAQRPVLVLSALDGGSDIARAFQAGASDYLSKPFNPQELLARLGHQLAQASGGALVARA